MNKDYITLDQCKKGCLYRINSRNLIIGVYDGNEGFIGIRTKFGDRYLFTEYHHDQGAPFGTVFPIDEIGPIPEGIEVREAFETIDDKTLRRVSFGGPVSQGGKGWYFIDTNEASKDIKPVSPMNQVLFDYLDEWMKQHIKHDHH